MLNENAKKWVEALRSGTYSQCIGYMHVSDSFDVLGVACDVYIKSHEGAAWGKATDKSQVQHFEGFAFALPEQVRSWLNLCDALGTVTLEDCTVSDLCALNDDGYTLPSLADFIEKHAESLFIA